MPHLRHSMCGTSIASIWSTEKTSHARPPEVVGGILYDVLVLYLFDTFPILLASGGHMAARRLSKKMYKNQ